MLSYQHAFHAGNHADVLKHLALVLTLDHLRQKPAPLELIDTHAGAGLYALDSDWAQKTREYEGGIGRLWGQAGLPEPLMRYLQCIRAANAGEKLQKYPGSPWLMHQALREQDRLWLFELHAADAEQLTRRWSRDRRVQVGHEDGLAGALARLPPASRRGLVLVDPAYETRGEYVEVLRFLDGAMRRFATGVVLLWYPILERSAVRRLERDIAQRVQRPVQLFELTVASSRSGRGMTGSLLLAINPPYRLMEQMRACLPALARVIGGQSEGAWRAEDLISEPTAAR
jgi:23S rRNA (adenine2030-N6)-methyltransferase